MSPSLSSMMLHLPSFPRVSGDEPAIKAFQEANGGFSPRERG